MHPRPYHLPAIFGPGPRVPMPPARLAVWKALLHQERRPGRVTIAAHQIGLALASIISPDGDLCVSHGFLAARVGVRESTVYRCMVRLRDCGLVTWTRRLVRIGPYVRQGANAYQLRVPTLPVLDAPSRDKPTRSLSHAFCRAAPKQAAQHASPGLGTCSLPSPALVAAAQQALAARRAVVEARLVRK